MRILTFDTTHHALWAEEIALERGFGIQIVPAPAASRAKCDLAIEVLPEDFEGLGEVLREMGVEFRVFEGLG